MGGEGVVAKRLDSRYEPGRRSGAWSKKRINIGQEFVNGGFTPGSKGGGQGLTAAKIKECIWIRPELVANCEFLGWTECQNLRV